MLNPNYVTGLVESSGIFTYTKMGGNAYPYFGIKMRSSDLSLLKKMQEFFGGIGTIYRISYKATRPATRAKSVDTRFFKVFRFDELVKLVWHFLDYPLEGKKAKAFKIWKDMVMLKTVNRKEDWGRLHELAAELTEANGAKKSGPSRGPRSLSTACP